MKILNKSVKRIAIIPALGLLAGLLAACEKEPDIVRLEPSVAWRIFADTSMTTFVEFLRSDQLLPPLNDLGKKHTVFAPGNSAFVVFFNDTLSHEGFDTYEELNANEVTLVRAIGNYHVVEGAKYTSADVPTTDSVATRRGNKIKVTRDGVGIIVNNTARVIEERTVPSGSAFIVDKVLVPASVNLKSLRQTIKVDSNTTTFAAALDRLDAIASRVTTGTGTAKAQQVRDSAGARAIINLLNGINSTRTVFVPSDQAFEEFFTTYPDLRSIDQMAPAKLINLVNNHILNGTIKRLVSSTVVAPAVISFTGANEAVVYKTNATTQGTVKITKSPFTFGTASVVPVENYTYRGVYYVIDQVQTVNSTGY